MDFVGTLQTGDRLTVNDQLWSTNRWFRLTMYPEGLLLVRNQVGFELWRPSRATPGEFAIMQGDGNFVTYDPNGAPTWDTHTDKHPGAVLTLQDDGDLVVHDAANRVLWQAHSGPALADPTIRYQGQADLSYSETSETWKQLCSGFPCFAAIQWPGYASTVVETVIDGQAVVVQLWKGLCPKFVPPFGIVNVFPGGVGAEVGVYRRIPGRVRPTTFPPQLPTSITGLLTTALSTLADQDLWWPAPELMTSLEYTLINPTTGQTVYTAGAETSYWLAKWMEPDSYAAYQKRGPTPARYEDYILEYTINGRRFPRWPHTPGEFGRVAQPAWQLLLTPDPTRHRPTRRRA